MLWLFIFKKCCKFEILYYVCNMKQRKFDFKLFAREVRMYRSRCNIGLRQAAGEIGTSAATLCRIENEGKAEIDTILAICECMGVTIGKFIKLKKYGAKEK
jgi:DNA-binding XRE family transcriptional regulator